MQTLHLLNRTTDKTTYINSPATLSGTAAQKPSAWMNVQIIGFGQKFLQNLNTKIHNIKLNSRNFEKFRFIPNEKLLLWKKNAILQILHFLLKKKKKKAISQHKVAIFSLVHNLRRNVTIKLVAFLQIDISHL